MSDPLPFTLPDKLLYRIQLRSELPAPSWFLNSRRLELPVVLVTEIGLARKADFAAWHLDPSTRVLLACDLIFPASMNAGEQKIRMKERTWAELGPDGRASVVIELDPGPELEPQNPFFVLISAFGENGALREDIVGLVLGEFVLDPAPEGSTEDESFVQVFRPVSLPEGIKGPFFRPASSSPSGSKLKEQSLLLVEEEWGAGIPGKAWDSAFVLAEHLRRKPSSKLPGTSMLLDLSSGNALLGVLMARIFPERTVGVTDLPEAMGLLQKNVERNSGPEDLGRIVVRTLDWSKPEESGLERGSVSLCVMSDLLYEIEFLLPLVGALKYLVEEDGELLVGYKRRGMSEVEEAVFFSSIEADFDRIDDGGWTAEGVGLMEGIGVGVYMYRCRGLSSGS